mgnify:CR=1 FL=1
MSQINSIKGKINSVKKTRKITSAMEMVAASKMRKAQERMQTSRPYAEKIRTVIAHVAACRSEYHHVFLEQREVTSRVGYIVVTTDRGLCGGLNMNLFRSFLGEMQDFKRREVDVDLCLIGKKGESFFKRHGGKVLGLANHLGDSPEVSDIIGVVKVMLDEFENGHESMSSSPTQQLWGEHHHVSHRVLLFASLLSLDDPAQWREQSSQFVLHVLFQVRDAVVRLRKLVQQRDRQAENTATVDDSSSLADIFGDCDFLVPVSEIIPIVQSEAVQAMLPEAAAQNVMPCFEASYESTVPVVERQLSMRGHELKKMLMDQEQASAFEESERARVEAHQTGLKDVVEGEPSNVWIDRFLYALSKRWHESNARLDEARKQQFCAFSQVGPQLCAHQSNIATEKLAVIATGHPRSNGSRRFCLSLERRGANPLRNGGGSYVYGVGRLGRASGRRGVA